MKTSNNGIQLIKSFEGLRLKAYLDVVGIPTIGFGTTGPEIKLGLEWTEQQCVDRLKKDLEKFEAGVLKAVKVPLTQNQFDALVCFVYNVGIGAFSSSTMLKKLNRSDNTTADEFLRWNKAGGKEVAGLTRRRQAEKDLFLDSKVESPQIKIETKLPEEPSETDMNDIFKNVEKDLFK